MRFCILFMAYLSEVRADVLIIFRQMRKQAVRAVLDTVVQNPEITAAFRAQRVQRTVAEQTVEILRVRACMTGKVFAVLV